jgi:hypothetical protein
MRAAGFSAASLRRFLVKLRFDWMTKVQARLAFQRFFDTAAPAGLDGLRVLTPADFSLVRRRAALKAGKPKRRRSNHRNLNRKAPS